MVVSVFFFKKKRFMEELPYNIQHFMFSNVNWEDLTYFDF